MSSVQLSSVATKYVNASSALVSYSDAHFDILLHAVLVVNVFPRYSRGHPSHVFTQGAAMINALIAFTAFPSCARNNSVAFGFVTSSSET
jgi:hypothetical protein